MSEWWRGLSGRERGLLLLVAAVTLLVLGYLLLWRPLAARQAALEVQVAEMAADLAWMRRAAPQVAPEPQQARPAGEDASLFALVERNAKQAGLGKGLTRIKPEGDEAVRVWLEEVGFDDLLRWLQALEGEYAIRAEELDIDREEAPGRVKARLRLVRTG